MIVRIIAAFAVGRFIPTSRGRSTDIASLSFGYDFENVAPIKKAALTVLIFPKYGNMKKYLVAMFRRQTAQVRPVIVGQNVIFCRSKNLNAKATKNFINNIIGAKHAIHRYNQAPIKKIQFYVDHFILSSFLTLFQDFVLTYGLRQSLRQRGHLTGLYTLAIHSWKQCLHRILYIRMWFLYHEQETSQ